VVCLVNEDRVLFSADTLMPVPYFVDGSYETSSARPGAPGPDVRDRGPGARRGRAARRSGKQAPRRPGVPVPAPKKHRESAQSKNPDKALERIDIESCGKSRIPLNGIVQNLHIANLRTLYRQLRTPS
jgi:hypothetical protein